MIERKIVIGLITNSEYLQRLQSIWNAEYIESEVAQELSKWCWEYFEKYKKAPYSDMEGIYIQKLKKGLNATLAEEIEQDILPELNEEYLKTNTNIDFLIDETKKYFIERQILLHTDRVELLLEKNELDKAKMEVEDFRIIEEPEQVGLELSDVSTLSKIENAFNKTYENLIYFPGALGTFWNDELRRGAFVGLMGSAKRGKTFWLLEFMMRAYTQGRKVAFFQAGDMTEDEQLLRMCVYLTKKPIREQNTGTIYIPQQDCIKNQTDTCNKKIRECNHGVFANIPDRKDITKADLIQAAKDFPEYAPCFNCVAWKTSDWGTPWLKRKEIRNTLSVEEAKKAWDNFFIKAGQKIKIASYSNGTLTVKEVKRVLDQWDREEQFNPDVILFDYVDIMATDKEREFRHRENEKWKGLRALSQEYKSLVITPTQADAESYKKNRLDASNYSEDRRKYDHVTAMFGLNQDTQGREKELGVMRINKIIVREGSFHSSQEVHVLQQLNIGRPFMGSYF